MCLLTITYKGLVCRTVFAKTAFLFATWWTVLLSQTGAVAAISVQEYFPEIGSDLTVVTWGHALNSQQKLTNAIQEKLMMLEADVVLGTVEGGSGEQIPVMAHPPDSVSDLSLENFLTIVIEANENGSRCGIKLDFKSIEVVQPALSQLKIRGDETNFPVMLNADILPGPVNSTTQPVNADKFLQLSVEQFPSSTLSVGWTTTYDGIMINGSYSEEHVAAMREALKRNQVTQPVTFPVRAGMVASSGATLANLRDIPNSTFTVWSAEHDTVNVTMLREVILDTLGRDRVFVDVPKPLSDQLQLLQDVTPHVKASAVIFRPSFATILSAIVAAILNKFK